MTSRLKVRNTPDGRTVRSNPDTLVEYSSSIHSDDESIVRENKPSTSISNQGLKGVSGLGFAARRNKPAHRRPWKKTKDSSVDGVIAANTMDITECFGRVEHCGYETAREAVAGDEFEAVLQGLINNMKATGICLSVSTAAELLSAVERHVPVEKKEQAGKLEQHFLAILEEVGETNSKEEFFEKSKAAIRGMTGTSFHPISNDLFELCIFSLQIANKALLSSEKNSEMHVHWRNFLHCLLTETCKGGIPRSPNNNWEQIAFNSLQAGDRKYAMKITTEAGDDSTEDEGTYVNEALGHPKPVKEFKAMPDVTLRATIQYLDGLAVQIPVLSAKTVSSATGAASDLSSASGTCNISTTSWTEVPASLTALPSNVEKQTESSGDEISCGTDTSNPFCVSSKRKAMNPCSIESEQKTKRQKHMYDAEDPGVIQLVSQHFLELLGAVRSTGDHINYFQSFGIYQDMNKIHFTFLAPACSDALNTTNEQKFKQFAKNRLASEYREANMNEPKMWFRMSTCKYLDLFKASHFKAFVAMVQYIVFHEFREVARKNRVFTTPPCAYYPYNVQCLPYTRD